MRIVREQVISGIRTSVYAWNNRYLIKFEEGMLEQTYKIDQSEVLSEDELVAMIDSIWINEIRSIFDRMATGFFETQRRSAQ